MTNADKKEMIIDAMRAAGYEYNKIESYDDYLIFNGEGVMATFKSWSETEDWLEGVVFDDNEISLKVEMIMHPERFYVKELRVEKLPKNPLDRYNMVKEHYPEHICFIQVGDFYEAFGEDAKKVADALDLVLTGRLIEGTDTRIPMCGFPLHNQDLYFQKLADKGLVPLAVARNMAEKVEVYDTVKNWDKKEIAI